MTDGIYRAGSGMLLEIKRQETASQNLAASGIPGYKREFIVSSAFENTLNSEIGSGDLEGQLLGSNSGTTRYDFSSGYLKKTDRRLDFAFDSYTRLSTEPAAKSSQLFFQVQTQDGKTLLTRNGCFVLDKDLNLTTPEGYKVMNENGTPLTLGADDNVANLCVSSDGQLKVEDRTTSPTTIKNIGFIQLAQVNNPQALVRKTANYFMDKDGKANVVPAKPETFLMKNGYYEDSNSSPIQEMTAMIQSVREYEFQSKVVKAVEEIHRQEQSKLS